MSIPKKDILPHPDDFRCVVEESWSKDVPASGAAAPIAQDINRHDLIMKAVAKRQGK